MGTIGIVRLEQSPPGVSSRPHMQHRPTGYVSETRGGQPDTRGEPGAVSPGPGQRVVEFGTLCCHLVYLSLTALVR